MNSEEIAQLRSYLTSQSMKRTPVQIYDALEEAYRQLLQTVDRFPETAFNQPHREGVWSIAEILEHVMLFMATYEQAICMVLEQGLQPPDINHRSEILLRQEPVKRLELLTALQSSLQHLARTIHQTEPDSHLEVTWKHFELGAMNWREWVLPLTAVDNSDLSPFRLTASSDSPYDKETIPATHFKQRGS